jgi:hypothetical protein
MLRSDTFSSHGPISGDQESEVMTPNRSALAAADPVLARSQTTGEAVVLRPVAIVGLLAIALIHLLDLQSIMEEAVYMGADFIGLIIACVFLAGLLAMRDDRIVWLACGGLATAVIVGFVVSRTVGLPNFTDDIGNWGEPLAVAALFAEVSVVAFAALSLRRRA